MIKVKQFWDYFDNPIESQITNFLKNKEKVYVDMSCVIDNDGDISAMLVYKEEEK